MPILLLDLPSEILILIFSSLGLATLTSCLATNRCVKSIIDGSALLQYRLAAQAACVEDNPGSIQIDSAHKLEMLQRRQDRFKRLSPRTIRTIELDDINLDGCKYALSGSIFAMAELDTKVLIWLSLANPEPVFQRLEVPGYIQDLALAIPDQDLLVVVLSSKPVADQPFVSDVAVELRFYEMSTQSGHPMAREHVMHVPSSGGRCPDIFESDICGPKVALLGNYYNRATRSWMFVYDWRSGCLLKSFSDCSYSAAVLLSPDVVLVTPKYMDIIEMWTVSDDIAAGPNISLLLPPPVEGAMYEIFNIGSEPKGYGSSPSQEPFYSSFTDSNIGLEIDFLFNHDLDRDESLFLVISRRALLQLLPPVEFHGKELAWKVWGPPIAHWLDGPSSWQSICGQRCAFAGPSGIRLVDLNPHEYKKAISGPTKIQTRSEAIVSLRNENRTIGVGLFAEEVRSHLGYLVAESVQDAYEDVFVGEECIVGLKNGLAPDSKKSIDIWYFG
ncbi:hypothetical protein B0H16DRAFT_186138 [Mycena metata]|uniref:F-box domain-containing protein n=1 Tax=Mycena metata TaxID=1033252 RepID=A0AAD7JTK8_9AGAR|nr:hypothetical protein B0H16DRAFT_186138 [Mycena metata]